uniref:phospholipase A2 n=1 Tax=Dermatophagoides pteronyssinus TaxID=6956 RepID=A0A6P6XYJ4_DERPT|nr:uncharacterized protein LOC113791455 [Dermatophagoides pteronyssinus]
MQRDSISIFEFRQSQTQLSSPPSSSSSSSSTNQQYLLIVNIYPDFNVSLAEFETLDNAINILHTSLVNLVNMFVPFFRNFGREEILDKIINLLQCYRDNSEWKVAHFAAFFNHVDYFLNIPIEELEDRNNPDQWSPLHIAVSMSNMYIIGLMLKSGMDVYIVDSKYWTVMHFAMLASPQVLSTLLEMNAFYQQLKHQDVYGMTPLHIACLAQNPRHIRRCMQQGITAKQLTIKAPKPYSLKLNKRQMNLLEWYTDPTPYIRFDNDSEQIEQQFDWQTIKLCGTPLHWCQCWQTINRLIDLNVFNINERDRNGDTPLMSFIDRLPSITTTTTTTNLTTTTTTNITNKSIIRIFNNNNDNDNIQMDNLVTATTGTSSASASASASSSSSTTTTPLLLSSTSWPIIVNYHLSWILRLIMNGARLNQRNHQGNTALHHAVLNGSIILVQLLIIFGSKINIRNKQNFSPLHLASSRLKQLQQIERIDNRLQRNNNNNNKQMKNNNNKKNNNNNNNNNQIVQQEKQQQQQQQQNIIILDGGINDTFMNPLIQILLLNELQKYLKKPIQNYFQIISGTSFGFTTGCSLAIGRKLFEILNFYLTLRSNFRKPLIRMQEHNTDRLEQTLLTMFNDPKTMADIRRQQKKHLILSTTVVDNMPARLKIIDDQIENLTLWKACRISGLGAGLFKTIEHKDIPYFDGSLIAPNPTFDILTFYQNQKILLGHKESSTSSMSSVSRMLPFRLILSLGSGRIAYRTDVQPIDLNSFRLYAPNLRVYFNYFRQLRDWFASILMETDGHIVQRSRYFALSQGIHFGRINVFYDRKKAKTSLQELDQILGQYWIQQRNPLQQQQQQQQQQSSSSSILTTTTTTTTVQQTNQIETYQTMRSDQLLLQILWQVKIQCYENRKQFRQMARLLKHSITTTTTTTTTTKATTTTTTTTTEKNIDQISKMSKSPGNTNDLLTFDQETNKQLKISSSSLLSSLLRGESSSSSSSTSASASASASASTSTTSTTTMMAVAEAAVAATAAAMFPSKSQSNQPKINK